MVSTATSHTLPMGGNVAEISYLSNATKTLRYAEPTRFSSRNIKKVDEIPVLLESLPLSVT